MTTLSLPQTSVDLSLFPAKVRKLFSMKGQIVTIRRVKDCKMRKGCAQIVKDSLFQARIGITYDNIANVQDKRDSGELPAENAGLPFGSWVPGLFNYLIEYKDKYYIRMALLHNDHSVRERRFLRNGVEVSVEVAQAECLASEFKNLSDVDVISFPIDDIIEINGEPV